MPDLSGRTAIVTGGATLIGRGVVTALAEAGAAVVIADIDAEGGAAAAEELGAAGHRVAFEQVDVTDDAAVDALVASTVATYGGLDVVINPPPPTSTTASRP